MPSELDFSPLIKRQSGVLLHITSLPGGEPNGNLGKEAFHFVDFLYDCGMDVWQLLPLGPTHNDGSPYQCLSVHAGNPLLIDLEPLIKQGILMAEPWNPEVLSWPLYHREQLHQAYNRFGHGTNQAEQQDFIRFKQEQSYWLEDYALYQGLRGAFQQLPWWAWPKELAFRNSKVLQNFTLQHKKQIEYSYFEQFLFFRQWLALKTYANQQGIRLFGDMPIFVAHDSVDVWAHQECFRLDDTGQVMVVAGVPPDYFSETGQRWGNPLYCWERIQNNGFCWWVHRLRTQLTLVDMIRIDHFRGFQAFWEIPAAAETAIEGRWVEAPGNQLFQALQQSFGQLPLVAEDLGVITEEVKALRRRWGFPGMRVLQFAFGSGSDNPHLPHNYSVNSVVYTGTHDNDTTLGWYQTLPLEARNHLHTYLGPCNGEAMSWFLIRTALASHARLAVMPLQDLLGLGSDHRMNTPGVAKGNWQWRFDWNQVPEDLAQKIRELVKLFGRGQ